jgi:hypothetical protein
MQQFIYEKHVQALSGFALSVLAKEEINKPVSERPVNCFGSTILTNPGHRETMRQRTEQCKFVQEVALKEKNDANTLRHVNKARAIAAKKTFFRVKKNCCDE